MKKSFPVLPILLVVAAGGAVAVTLTVMNTPPTVAPGPGTDGPATSLATPQTAPELAEIPPAVRTLPADPSDAVKRLAKAWPADVGAFHKELAALAVRPIPGDPGADGPRSARELAEAIEGKRVLPAASFERAILATAILRARGEDPRLGAVVGAKHAASELLARRFVVGTGAGPWVALDALPLDQGQVVPLADVDVAANVMGFRLLAAINRGDKDGASRLAGLLRRLRLNDPALLFTIGRSEVAGGLGEIGEATMNKAAALASDAMTHYLLGLAARELGRPFKADAAFRKATELDPTFGDPWVQLAELAIGRLDLTPKNEQPALIQTAKDALAAGTKASPDTLGLRLVGAHLAALEDRYDEAATLLTEETRLHPRAGQAWVALAEVLVAQDKSAEAIKALEAARLQGLDTAQILAVLGALYATNERVNDAVPLLERALKLDPGSRELRPELAQLKRHLGKGAEAKALLLEHTQRFPDDVNMVLLLAQLELEQGDVAGARARIGKVLAQDPDHKDARLLDYLARLVASEDPGAARARAVAALGSRKKLAEFLLGQGFDKEGEALLLEAMKEEPEELEAPVLLVALYTARGQDKEATRVREETLARVAEGERAELTKMFDEAVLAGKTQQP